MTAITELVSTKTDAEFAWWQVFLIAFFGSIVLEYGTSWLLEKLFHAYWWDYSDVPLNINGRVCLPASIGFGLAGLLVVYVIAPFTLKVTVFVPPIVMEFMSLLLMALMAADTTLTISALTNFEHNVVAMEEALNQHMEQFVIDVQEKTQAAGAAFAEERERFSREKLEQAIASIGGTHRRAVTRVKGFKTTRVDKQKIEYMIERFKTRVPKKK